MSLREREMKPSQCHGRETASSRIPLETLSRREREVYELVCEGLSNGDIAKRLFITEGTVKVHVHHVFDKVGIRSRTALALNAVRDRLLQAAPTSTRRMLSGARKLSTESPNLTGVVGLKISAFCGAILLGCSGEDRLECGDYRRVELALHSLSQPESGDATRHGISVWAIWKSSRCRRLRRR